MEQIENHNKKIYERKIKHIVISGGSIWGFAAFGILHEAISSGFLNMDDILSLYTTSAGSIIGVMMSLKIDHTILKDYLVSRHWEDVCKKSLSSVLEIYDNKGIIQKTFFDNMFSPLLKSVDLDTDITMIDLYNYNKIDIHIYVTELNSFALLDISHKTHPNWLVIDAIYASCTIPILFSPIIIENKCYIDGGFFLNYPISKCIENIKNYNEILGISLGNDYNNTQNHFDITHDYIKPDSNIFDLLNVLFNRIIGNINFLSNDFDIEIPYKIHFFLKITTLEYSLNVLYSKEERYSLIYNGINSMKTKLDEWFHEKIVNEKITHDS